MIWDVQSSSLNKYQCPSSFTVYKVLCCTFEPHATLWGRYYYYSHFIDKTTETIKVEHLHKARGASWPVCSRCGIQVFQGQMPRSSYCTWLPYTQHLPLWLGYCAHFLCMGCSFSCRVAGLLNGPDSNCHPGRLPPLLKLTLFWRCFVFLGFINWGFIIQNRKPLRAWELTALALHTLKFSFCRQLISLTSFLRVS